MRYADGLLEYLRDVWNYFDITHFVLYLIYFNARVFGNSSEFIIPS